MVWKSVMRKPLEDGYERGCGLPVWDEEWLEAVAKEPWFVGLLDLTRWTGMWVGTGEELLGELRMRVDREVRESPDFPRGLEDLMEFQRMAADAFETADGLSILDHREFTKKELQAYDVPGWGPEAPVLVRRGKAGERPHFYFDGAIPLLKYRSPLPLAVLVFTDGRSFTKKNRVWSGTSGDLAKKLKASYPVTIFNLPRLHDPKDPYDQNLFDHSDGTEELLEPYSPEEYRRFCARMRTCAHIVREVGIEVSWERGSYGRAADGSRETRLVWTVEAPRWRH